MKIRTGSVALGLALFAAAAALAADETPAAKMTATVTVTYSGPPVVMKKLHREADAFCVKTVMTDEEVLVKDGKLQNVLVRVTKGATGNFAPPAAPLVVAQQNCMYRPRVSGVREGQAVTFKSEDETTHNVHVFTGEKSLFNRIQTKGEFTKKPSDLKEKSDAVISLKCDIHPWMSGFLLVVTNPYFGVTDETGTTTLDLPAGTYTIEAWHERYGTKTQTVAVDAGKPAVVKFDFAGTDRRR